MISLLAVGNRLSFRLRRLLLWVGWTFSLGCPTIATTSLLVVVTRSWLCTHRPLWVALVSLSASLTIGWLINTPTSLTRLGLRYTVIVISDTSDTTGVAVPNRFDKSKHLGVIAS
jgi:hypothetical protein